MMKCSIPAARASSTTCWIIGRSTTVSISFGIALVAGRKRVPRPATGKTALRIAFMEPVGKGSRGGSISGALITGKPYLVPYHASIMSRVFPVMSIVRHIAWLAPLLVSAAALAQDDRYPQSLPAITGSVSGAQSDQWSGEPGASGHPLMTPDAI